MASPRGGQRPSVHPDAASCSTLRMSVTVLAAKNAARWASPFGPAPLGTKAEMHAVADTGVSVVGIGRASTQQAHVLVAASTNSTYLTPYAQPPPHSVRPQPHTGARKAAAPLDSALEPGELAREHLARAA